MELIEILNPLDIEPQFFVHQLQFEENKTIAEYIPDSEKYCFVNIDQEELSLDHVITDTDIIFFSRNIGGKTAAIIVAVIAIVILSIFTFGSAAYLAGMGLMTMGTATTAATLTFAGQVVFSLAMMALSISLSILMAPKQPDMGEEKGDERSVYLWGQQHTVNKQMIPIPVLLGRFPTFGNMICSRTVPLEDNSKTVFEPLAEYGYYQFGLCSNPVSDLDMIYLNNFDVVEMHNDDITFFYTKGKPTQSYLYALPPDENSNIEDDVYRFMIPSMVPGTLPKNGQLADDEPLNPGICIETVKNQMMDHPSHAQLATIFESNDVIYGGHNTGYNDTGGYFYYDNMKSAEMISPEPIFNNLPITVEIFPVYWEDTSGTEIRKPRGTYPDFAVKWYTKEYNEDGTPTGHELELPYPDSEEFLVNYSTGNAGNYVQKDTQVLLKGRIIEEIEGDVPTPPKDPNADDPMGGGRRISRDGDDGWYPITTYTRKGWSVELYWATETTVHVETDVAVIIYPLEEIGDIRQEIVQDPHHVNQDDANWHFWSSTIDYADSIEVEFVAPSGMYYEYTRNSRGGKLLDYAFVTFEWEITASVLDDSGYYHNKGLYITSARDIDNDMYPIRKLFTHPRSVFNDTTLKYIDNPNDNPYDGPMQPIFGITDWTKLAFTRFVKLKDIIDHPYVKTLPGYPRLDYDRVNNKLWDGTYNIKIRIKDHGTHDIYERTSLHFFNVDEYPGGPLGEMIPYYNPDPVHMCSYGIVLPEEQQLNWSNVNDEFPGGEELVYTINFFKIREYDYMATCSFPYTTVAGVAFKATEAYNGRLPSLMFIAKGEFLVYKGTGDPTDFSNNWEYTYTTNPGYMSINLLFDSYYGASLGGPGSREPQGSQKFNDCVANFLKRIDLTSFLEFAEYCNEPDFIPGLLVYDDDPQREDYTLCEAPDPEDPLHDYDGKYLPKRYSCNAIIDKTKSILDWLGTLLGSYDAFITFYGLKLAILYDKQLKTFVPKQIFTSSNIIENSFKQSFMDPSILATYVETTYLDEENLWQKTPVIYKPYGSLEYTGNKKTKVSVFGYTNVNRVIHRLHQVLKKTSLLSQQIEFATSTQGFTRRAGDPIGVTFEFIEWGVIQNSQDVIQTSGRILKVTKVDSSTAKILLDRLIAFEDVPVDLVGKTVLLVSSSDDSLFIQAQISGNNIVFGKTELEIQYNPVLDKFEVEDMFLLGKTAEAYKEAIITKITFDSDNRVKIIATVYDPAIWERGTLITEIFGNIFTKELVGILDCKTQYVKVSESIEVNWMQPVILSSVSAINLDFKPENKVIYPKIENKINNDPTSYLDQLRARYRVEFIKYKVYRLRVEPFDSSQDKDGINGKWEFVGESQVTNFSDPVSLGVFDYIYKVTTVLRINGIIVDVPLSWNSQCITRTPEFHDYLNKVEVLDYFVERQDNSDLYDLTLVVRPTMSLRADWNNMLLAWVKVAGTSNYWVGNLAIRLVKDAPKGSGFIEVNSILGLPTDNKGKVFGLIVINDEEIVMVDGHRQISSSHYLLRLRFYDEISDLPASDRVPRRYYLGTSQKRNATVKNAHLGLYPVKYFAIAEDNNINSNPDSNYMTCDSLYYFDYEKYLRNESGTLYKVFPTEEKFRSEIETIPISSYYPINIGINNLITFFRKAGATNPPLNNKFFFELGRTQQYIQDLEIGLAYLTRDKETHDIKVVGIEICPEHPELPVMRKYDSGAYYCTFTNISIPSGSTLWVALTHIQTLGEHTPSPYGYTSYPVLIDGNMKNRGNNE